MFWLVVWPRLALAGFGLCLIAANKINHRVLPAAFFVALIAAFIGVRSFMAGQGVSLEFEDALLGVFFGLLALAIGGAGWLVFGRPRYAGLASAIVGVAWFATAPYSIIITSCATGLSCI